ncbi:MULTISPECIES: hypothetical protein [Micromonospora]|uniref:hypothetical protein n=1 Tax=Micromonospora TaxID=1873 RepID=UPI001183538E|nr:MULTISPECIES: hypothetical protein [unclassified Micromonospora]
MLTEILAAYAAVVSTSALAVSWLTYRSGNPRLSGDATLVEDDKGEYGLWVDIRNRGRSVAFVRAMNLQKHGYRKRRREAVVIWGLYARDATYPLKIEAHSGDRFHFRPRGDFAIKWSDLRRWDPALVKVEMTNGKSILIPLKFSKISIGEITHHSSDGEEAD